MDDYTVLSDDSFDDFIVSGNCQENRTVRLRFKILELYRVMLLHTFKNFEQKLSNSLRCAEDEVGKLF